MKTFQARSIIRSSVMLVALVLSASTAWSGPPQITQGQLATMQPLDPSALPTFGNFWLLIGPDPGQPMPPLPAPPNNLPNETPIYDFGDSHYLIDDSAVNWDEVRQEEAMESDLRNLEVEYGLVMPLETEEESETFEQTSYPSNSLWLAISQITNGVAPVTINGTLPGLTYEILSKETLTDAEWLSEGTVPGALDQDWTPTGVTVGSRTNSLFLMCRSWISNDGTGIPDWWKQFYFGTNAVDPYALCPSNSWTILQAFQNGWNPYSYYTPPTPQGLTVSFNSVSGTVNVRWRSSPGQVTGYTVCKNSYTSSGASTTTFNPGASTVSIVDTVVAAPYSPAHFGPTIYTAYTVQAHYAAGDSACSDPVWLEPTGLFTVNLVVAAQNAPYLNVRDLPSGTVALRLTRIDYGAENDFGDSSHDLSWDIPLASFTGGLCTMPTNAVPPDTYGFNYYYWWVQTLDGSNGLSAATYVTDQSGGGNGTNATWLVPPFLDGRRQMQQNNDFLLRIPSANLSFGFVTTGWHHYDYPLTYVYSGLYQVQNPYSYSDTSIFDAYKPFEDSSLFRNFEFSEQDMNSNGHINTGLLDELIDGELAVQLPLKYQFIPPSTASPIAPVLQTTPWTSFLLSAAIYGSLEGLNITDDANIHYMTNSTPNYFGLHYLSAIFAYNQGGTLHFDTLLSGGSITNNGGYVYPQTATPSLQTIGYYFARPGIDPLPGNDAFSPANTTPSAMVAGFGQNFQLAGYAKQRLVNGYSNVFSYLGQYFEHAYAINTSGNVTTNQAGFLSPYGTFFPTLPGPAALVTMTNWGANERGTGVVNVIKLQLDMNHDGIMDLSLAGPDNTSVTRPYVHWMNNDFDRFVRDSDLTHYYDDSVLAADCPYTRRTTTPDCNYQDGDGHRAITCERDLQDFARLWVCGITTNLIAALPSGSTVTLSWGDVESPDPANPTIDLFAAADSDGGIGYLTNSSTASVQASSALSPHIKRLGPGQSIQLNSSQFANGWAGNYFIWCGVSNGTGGLILTIADSSGNTLAQTTAYIQITDIKQMYERWTIGDRPDSTPANAALVACEGLTLSFQYAQPAPTNTPYILYVHGWNMQVWEKDRFAESAFKRLYWQGYQGRFGVFRWPTDNGFTGSTWSVLTDSHNYDGSEFIAWQSATGLVNKLNDLNTQYPGHVYVLAHSMGNVVAGEALRLAGNTQVVNTYIASQAAIPAHVYDSTVTNLIEYTHKPSSYPFSMTGHPITPNIYGDRLATNNAAVGRRINFYNMNDFALAADLWCFDQALKPDTLVDGYYHYSGSTNDAAPWNNFQFTPYGGDILTLDIVNNLLQRYEALAYAAQPYSKALGSTSRVTTMDGVLNLTTVWPSDSSGHNYADHFWHSAQFRGDCWQEWNYWHTLLRSQSLGFNLSN